MSPQDSSSSSLDPFLKVSIGRTVIDDQENFVTADLNPIFGKLFELRARLPMDNILKVAVMDWDVVTRTHNLVGETCVDLEDRFCSSHRATCGLPETMSRYILDT